MAEDNRIFGDNEVIRNSFFNALGDMKAHQEQKDFIVRIKSEFLSYEDDPQKQAQFKETYPDFIDFCIAIQRYWWGEDGDRIKYRKMTNRQRERYTDYIFGIGVGDNEDHPKGELSFALYYE